MRGSSRSSAMRPIARVRLEKVPVSQIVAGQRPPVFHIFEELYARTLREMEGALQRGDARDQPAVTEIGARPLLTHSADGGRGVPGNPRGRASAPIPAL